MSKRRHNPEKRAWRGALVQEGRPRTPDPEPNPICDHDHRIHPLGGGLWVCFECWARLLLGGRPKP